MSGTFFDTLAVGGYSARKGRAKRAAAGGSIYHVVNRANARMRIFKDAADYEAFLRILDEARQRYATRLLACCLMSNHWHLVLWPVEEGELSRYMGWVTLTHTQRWHAHRHTTGSGHLYQGRFKSFPVQDGEHFLTVCRYVERNALRGGLVARAEAWKWGSLWRWMHGTPEEKRLLGAWPLPRRPGWVNHVNEPLTERELDAIRRSVNRGNPFGDALWSEQMTERLGLETTIRPRGRPRKQIKGS